MEAALLLGLVISMAIHCFFFIQDPPANQHRKILTHMLATLLAAASIAICCLAMAILLAKHGGIWFLLGILLLIPVAVGEIAFWQQTLPKIVNTYRQWRAQAWQEAFSKEY